jgi:DNA-binding transcriptional LysR family regulator
MVRSVDWESRIGRHLRLRDLHVFFAVVKSGSMARAAASLRVTQPAVSKSIGDLEAVLGVRLFDRSSHGVVPTIYGNELIKCGSVVFDELKQGIRNIEFLADPTSGELRIGCPESISSTILPPIIQRFSQQFPRVVLDVTDVTLGFAPMLRERSLDLVLSRQRGWADTEQEALDDLNVDLLFNDELVLAAGMQSRWARRRRIDLADLANERWMLTATDTWNYQTISAAFRTRGLAMPKIQVKTLSLSLRTSLLVTGEYITALPRSLLRFRTNDLSLKVLPVDLPPRPWPVAIVTLKHRTLSPVVERFIDCARDVAKSFAFRGRPRKA